MKFKLIRTSAGQSPVYAESIEIDSLEELLELHRKEKYPLIINTWEAIEHREELLIIEIYDDYRE